MPTTVQLNTRIDPELKRAGDAVFARAGLSSSQVVRRVWESAARTQEVPACVQDPTGQKRDVPSSVREGLGIARRTMHQQGIALADLPLNYQELHDGYYDDYARDVYAQLA